MRKKGNLIFYVLMLLIFGAIFFKVLDKGRSLEKPNLSSKTLAQDGGQTDKLKLFVDSFSSNLSHPLPVLLLQVMIIIIVVRIFGFLFNKIGQPSVVGEIIAGIVLGPSILGYFFPDIFNFIFPVSSFANIQFLSQVGLMLFMFVIGMELDINLIRKQAQEAVIISHASIVIPYTLGVILAYYLYEQFAPSNISFSSFALFMGIATSITAFPVLARIIQERNLARTKLGVIAITCAAADDVTAWCILAALIAIVKAGSSGSTIFTLGLVVTYLLVMVFIVHPLIKKLGTLYSQKEIVSKSMMAIVFMVMLVSAYATELIGIHALFGAFMAGIIMPQGVAFRKKVTDKIEDVSLVLLLPLFFVFTGLRTHIGLLNQGHLWTAFGWIVLVAVAGKFGGSAIAAKVVGQNWQNSLSIGALMNTRGLVELVVLNIGYDLGILKTEVFTMMVLMALVTTFMTSPALNLINWFYREKTREVPEKNVQT